MQKPIRVLIVDDQPHARKSLKALLSTWPRVGEMYEAGDGREAVRLVEEIQPDMVLIDVRMPELDGLKATAQIKAARPGVKVIVLSMYIEYRDEALAVGADAFVAKGDAASGLLGTLAAITGEI
jgi:NarL family two-component system response regulator LiaR